MGHLLKALCSDQQALSTVLWAPPLLTAASMKTARSLGHGRGCGGTQQGLREHVPNDTYMSRLHRRQWGQERNSDWGGGHVTS